MSTNCNDSIVNIPQALYGQNGVSSYTYIAFADTVDTTQNPDLTTGFSLTPGPNTQWMGIITSTVPISPLTPVDFNTFWVKIKGNDGVGAAGINVEVNNSAIPGGPYTSINFVPAGLTGVSGSNAGGGEVTIDIVTAAFNLRSRGQMLTLMASNQLVPGVSYWIFDQGDGADCSIAGDAGIVVRAVDTNQISTDAIYVARVLNRANVTQVFNSHTSYTTNTIVEHFNEAYVLNGVTNIYTTPPSNDPTWTFIDKSNTTYYLTEIHTCTYNINVGSLYGGIITSRSDFRGNTITNVGDLLTTGNEVIQQCFRWGTDIYKGNNILVDQNSQGWISGRLPSFAFDVSYFTFSFKDNTINKSILYNSLFEGAYTFDTNIVNNSTIEISTNTAGSYFPINFSNCTLVNTTSSTPGNYNINFDKNTFINSSITNITNTNTGSLLFWIGNNFVNSTIDTINNSAISYNEGKVSLYNIVNSNISYNTFSIDALQGSILNIYDCDISFNNFNGIFQIGDPDNPVFSGLTAPNDIFNGYSICRCTIAQNSSTGHVEMSRIRPNLSTNTLARSVNQIVGCTFSGSFPQGFSNILFTKDFRFLYLTFLAEGNISQIDTNTTASYSATAGSVLPATFGKSMIQWRDWTIGIPIVGALSAGGIGLNKPYNMVTCGSDINNNYFIEISKDTDNPGTKEVVATKSNVIGYLDLADTNIFSAGTGTLTIPIGMQFCGIYYLYNTTANNIVRIANLNSLSVTLGITKEFRVLNGTGVTFTPTAKASATPTTMLSTLAGPFNLAPITDFILIKNVGLASGVANITLEITQVSIKL